MQKKRVRGGVLLDKLHRGAVCTCIGVTLFGCCVLGMRAFRFYTVVKPEWEKAELQRITAAAQNNDEDLKC